MRKGKSCSRSFELGLSACGGKLHVHHFFGGNGSFFCRSKFNGEIVSDVLSADIRVNARNYRGVFEINFHSRSFAAVKIYRAVISFLNSVDIIRNSRHGNLRCLSAFKRTFWKLAYGNFFHIRRTFRNGSDRNARIREPEENSAFFVSIFLGTCLHKNVRREFSVIIRG